MRATSTAAAEERPLDSERSGGTAGGTTPPSVVLLAEDDHAMRELLKSVFTADGYEVVEARDGSELISHLHDLARTPHGRESLAVVISDVRMPRLDGLDVLAALRCAHWYTPVILITAFGDEATHRDAHDFGAVAVLDKPFDLSSLRDLVRQIAA